MLILYRHQQNSLILFINCTPQSGFLPSNTLLQLEWALQKSFLQKSFLQGECWCFTKPWSLPRELETLCLLQTLPGLQTSWPASRQGSVGNVEWVNSGTPGWGIWLQGILPLPLGKGNTAAKYSCHLYLVLPCSCTGWRGASPEECLPQTRGWEISCRDVYTALHASPSAGRHTGISFHCVSPAVFKQEHCPSFTLTEKNNFHQQSCIYLLPKEDILPVPLYIGHLLWALQEFQAPVHSRAYTREIPPYFQCSSLEI